MYPAAVLAGSIAGTAADVNPGPELSFLSAMTDPTAATFTGFYTQAYNEIVQPGRVWKISKYFLRRWTPYLGPSDVWLVIGARQESYFNGRRPWFTAYDQQLAAAAGIHVRSFRRAAKKEIAGGMGALALFLSKEGDPGYVTGQPVPRQEETRYRVRLDDPLTPADARALAYWLRRNGPEYVTAETVAALLAEARQEPPYALRAREIDPAADALPARPLLAAAEVVASVFPDVAGERGWREAADRLHTHIVEAQLAHLETHYFRHRWLAELGPGPALLLVYLRSLCYHNPQTGETRDEVTLLSGELEQLFQKSSVTVRAWFARLEAALGAGHPHGPFLEVAGMQKLPTQKVATTYRLNLLTPLHPDDLPRYHEALAAARPEAEQGVAQEMSATLADGRESFVRHVGGGSESSVPHANGGQERNGRHVGEGGESSVSGSEKKWQPYKYYQDFFIACGVKDFPRLFEDLQQQHAWHLHDRRATGPFAAVAAGSLPELLDSMGVLEPSRGEILRAAPPPDVAVAWALYVRQESGLANPAGYLIRRLLGGDDPPADFLALARMSWEQWRVCAAAAYLQGRGYGAVLAEVLDDGLLRLWQAYYGQAPPGELPFGVGEGLGDLPEILPFPEAGFSDTGEDPAGVSPADAAVWQSVLDDLALQMTQATFATWLADARLAAREGNRFVVALRSEEVRDWVCHRLQEPILRTLRYITRDDRVELEFVVKGA